MKRRLLAYGSVVLLCAGLGLAVDGDTITDPGDAFWSAMRFLVIAVAAPMGSALVARAGIQRRESSPRTYQVVAWLLAALPVVSLAWLVIDADAPGWRRLGLVLVALGGLAATLLTARAGMLSGRFRPEPAREQQRP
ncbi:hypothetical protein [Cryptosporangium japonicum]|uniref:Integral membrane protein n=1 Tax=Cryptosporangium japonicum TaxID=80872 RepID=A0ABN0U3K3_9ACTN